VVLPLSILYGESRLLASWCAGDRCDMVASDEDRDRSRRPCAEDRDGQAQVGYSVTGRSRGQVTLCAICIMHKETLSMRFLVWPQNQGRWVLSVWPQNQRLLVFWFGHQNHRDVFLVYASKLNDLWFVGCAIKPTGR
jgi:hypothetical protein